ncbi:hypothetical protein ACHAW5_010123 [Stephanodiscus triporus]|uniref:Uncharacterized protein n=1 Tax=Stephanodiscus triporus TaxID=2934178 RepID=A0ABD3N5A5_9STRA
MPKSMLLDTLIAAPVISEGIKRRAVQALISLEEVSRNCKPVKYLERKVPSLDAARVIVSYAEAKICRLFFKPITVPLRVWLSWKGTKMWKRMNLNTASNGGSDSSTYATTGFTKDSAFLMKGKDTQSWQSTSQKKEKNHQWTTKNGPRWLHLSWRKPSPPSWN